jgi:hypothetical protein
MKDHGGKGLGPKGFQAGVISALKTLLNVPKS